MQSLDAAAFICKKQNIDQNDRLAILYSAMFHDIGKLYTTRIINNRITSYNHEVVGAQIVSKSLTKIVTSKTIISRVPIFIRYHMAPLQFIKQNSTHKAYQKLAVKIAKYCNLYLLSLLSLADLQGRNGDSNHPDLNCIECDKQIKEFIKKAEEYKVLNSPIKPLIDGKTLLNFLKPGILMGQILKYAYKYQINNNIHNKDILLKHIILKFKLKKL
jgi:putative nucleotidyltransferase with HDIG domain